MAHPAFGLGGGIDISGVGPRLAWRAAATPAREVVASAENGRPPPRPFEGGLGLLICAFHLVRSALEKRAGLEWSTHVRGSVVFGPHKKMGRSCGRAFELAGLSNETAAPLFISGLQAFSPPNSVVVCH